MDTIERPEMTMPVKESDMLVMADLAAAVAGTNIAAVDAGAVTMDVPVQTAFEYGWCKTDHKEGKEIRRDFRQTDYINDEPYAGRLHTMLDQLGLPFPKPEEVFRGTHHDLLFLNSHGVVVRIGPTDVQDLVNPGIIQPLGWIEDNENKIPKGGRDIPFTVAIYPGIELIGHYQEDHDPNKPKLVGDLHKLMQATGANTCDVADYNCGIIRVFNDDGSEVAVKMLLDPDNEYNAAYGKTKEMRDTRMREQEESTKATKGSVTLTKGEMLFNTLRDVFNAARDVKYWERAQELHQPLRNMFWDAFDDVEPLTGKPDAQKRAAFWEKCAAVTNKPMPVTLPVWRTQDNEGGGLSFVRDEIAVPHLVLYRPWTGNEQDRITKPIEQSPELKAAIERAHRDAITRPAQAAVEAKPKPKPENPEDYKVVQDENGKKMDIRDLPHLRAAFGDAVKDFRMSKNYVGPVAANQSDEKPAGEKPAGEKLVGAQDPVAKKQEAPQEKNVVVRAIEEIGRKWFGMRPKR